MMDFSWGDFMRGLADDEIELTGGVYCPECSSENIEWLGGDSIVNVSSDHLSRVEFYKCGDCGHEFSD